HRKPVDAIVFAGSRFWKVFLVKTAGQFWVILPSSPFSGHARVCAWREHHCDSRKALQQRIIEVFYWIVRIMLNYTKLSPTMLFVRHDSRRVSERGILNFRDSINSTYYFSRFFSTDKFPDLPFPTH